MLYCTVRSVLCMQITVLLQYSTVSTRKRLALQYGSASGSAQKQNDAHSALADPVDPGVSTSYSTVNNVTVSTDSDTR